MKVQMIYNNRDYIKELDRPQAIEDEEFSQEILNEWMKIYFKDNEVEEIEKECYGFILFDDDMNVIDVLYYKKK